MSPTTVSADLIMELNVTCPNPECEHVFDLFKERQNEEGQLYDQVITDDRWKIPSEERLDTNASCPKCGCEFDVKGVNW